jgi:hypothetical protein
MPLAERHRALRSFSVSYWSGHCEKYFDNDFLIGSPTPRQSQFTSAWFYAASSAEFVPQLKTDNLFNPQLAQ